MAWQTPTLQPDFVNTGNWSKKALGEAKRARSVRLGKRTDLRDTPLITIDGADEAEFGHVLSAVDLAKEAQAWPIVFLTNKME